MTLRLGKAGNLEAAWFCTGSCPFTRWCHFWSEAVVPVCLPAYSMSRLSGLPGCAQTRPGGQICVLFRTLNCQSNHSWHEGNNAAGPRHEHTELLLYLGRRMPFIATPKWGGFCKVWGSQINGSKKNRRTWQTWYKEMLRALLVKNIGVCWCLYVIFSRC